jgi:hypothetical protein
MADLELTTERYALYEEYYKLKDDVKSVEVIRHLMSADAPERGTKRA